MNQNEKLERFAQEINKNAEAQVKKIETKTARATKQQLDQFAQKAKAEFDARASYETNRLRTSSNREIAQLHAQVRQAAVQHREALVQQVFARAEEALLAFCATDAYAEKLRDSIVRLVSQLGDNVTVFVCARDEAAAKDICKALPAVASVCVRDSIRIGLAAACNAAESLFLEDTFDSRLQEQRDSFLLSSGLTLEA